MPKTQDQTKQDGNLSIPRVGKRKEGYDPAQVDEFLERSHQLYDSPEPRLTQEEIQNTSFSIVKNGYSVAEVDAALTRLEGAVVDTVRFTIAQPAPMASAFRMAVPTSRRMTASRSTT